MMSLLGVAEAATLEGVVRELGVNTRVPYALVRSDGVSVETNERGEFVIELPEGTARVEVIHPAYEPHFVDVELPRLVPMGIYLEPAAVPLEVVVEARRDLPHSSTEVLDRERVEQTPGTHGDAARLVQALPGVTVTREYSPSSGDVSIRGAAPADSRFYLDGVELPYLFHFQQYASVFHTRLLDEVSIFPSAFGAGYGDAIGGVVNAESRPPEKDGAHGGVSGDLVMGGAWVATPVGEEGHVGVSASARRSYADLMSHDSEWYTIWPTFWDYLGRTHVESEGGGSLDVTLFGAGDRYGRYLQQPEELGALEAEANAPFTYDRAFHALSVRGEQQLGSTHLSTTGAVVSDLWKGELPGADQRRGELYGWFRGEVDHWFSDSLELNGGVQAKWQRVDLDVDTDRSYGELAGAAPLLVRGVSTEERLERVSGGVWVEPRIHLGGWRLQPGLRAQGDSMIGAVTLDPRFNFRGEFSEDFRLRGAVGRYSQSPRIELLSEVIGDSELPMASSTQFALGVDYAYASRLEFEAEVWGKQLYNLVVEEAGEAPHLEDGMAWGVELGSRYRLRDRFFTWTSITVGRSLRDGSPFEYDQPFAFSLVGSWNVGGGWTLAGRYRYAVGLPYTPVVEGLYDGDTDTWDPVFGDTNSERMPSYQKFDLRVERKWRFNRWSLVAYCEAWWVPPANNTLYPVYSYDYSEEVLVGGPAFVPLVGMRGEM